MEKESICFLGSCHAPISTGNRFVPRYFPKFIPTFFDMRRKIYSIIPIIPPKEER
jgi:hypothetical protein